MSLNDAVGVLFLVFIAAAVGGFGYVIYVLVDALGERRSRDDVVAQLAQDLGDARERAARAEAEVAQLRREREPDQSLT